MLINMRLHEEPYLLIASGKKTIECRTLDEKRKKLNIGDTIEFIRRANTDDRIRVTITALKIYNNFEEMFDSEKNNIRKYTNLNKKEFVTSFNEYYPPERQKDFPPLAIHFEKT